MSYVFISYSTKNKKYIKRLAAKLQMEGFDIWIDNEQLRAGKDWWTSIVAGIKDCDAFLVVMTPESDASDWVKNEIVTAFKFEKPKFPLWLDGDPETPNWLVFGRTQYEDVSGNRLPSPAFYEALAKVVHREQGGRGADVTLQLPKPPLEKSITETDFSSMIRYKRRSCLIRVSVVITMSIIVLVGGYLFINARSQPTLVAFTSPALAGRNLNDVAAANGHVWFATSLGLVHINEEQDVNIIAEDVPITRVAVSQDGNDVWFSDSNRIGHYARLRASLEWLTPSIEDIEPISDVQVEEDGTVWFSDFSGLIFSFANNNWQLVPQPETELGNGHPFWDVRQVALAEANLGTTLWAVNGVSESVYRWYSRRWFPIFNEAICGATPCGIAVVSSDRQNRAWIGHNHGITFFSESLGLPSFQRCVASDFGINSLSVTDMVFNPDNASVWFVTLGELVRFNVEETMPDDCGNWQSENWSSEDFWSLESFFYRMAVDNTGTGDSVIWVIKSGTSEVLMLTWHP